MKKKILTSLTFLLVSLLTFQVSFATSVPLPLSDGDQTNDTCLTLQTPLLRYLSRDVNTNGEVSALQDFLISKGLLSGSPTGFYGRLTVSAVKSYQQSKGVIATGNVGPLTKSVIQNETCGSAVAPYSFCALNTEYFNSGYYGCICPNDATRVTFGSNKFKCINQAVVCTMEMRFCPDGTGMPRDADCTWRSDKCQNNVACTMEMRFCPDGTGMPRDNDCTWRSDKCPNLPLCHSEQYRDEQGNCVNITKKCPDGRIVAGLQLCDSVGPNQQYSLGLLPVTTSQSLRTGVNYTTGWTGTGNTANQTYVVDLVKGVGSELVTTLGTASASLRSFGFSFPTSVVTGSDYRLRFGGTGGEMTNMFGIQGR